MKFVLWFEPERVAPGSDLDREHPDWLIRIGDGDRLLNLGLPEARRWMTDLLSRRIEEWAVDIYREDFNIDPLPFWQAADQPDRQGMTEIRFVEGLYEMWGELIRRHPGLAVDNCASGGRRIDLETLSLSYPLWRSDWSDAVTLWHPDHDRLLPIGQQVQMAGLTLWAPLSSCGVYRAEPYFFRSALSAGTVLYADLREPGFPKAQARRDVAELQALRRYMLGDFYPLLPVTAAEGDWCAWQWDAPEEGGGAAVFLRRPDSPYPEARIGLRGLEPTATYSLTWVGDDGRQRREKKTGSEMSALDVRIETAPGSVVLRYEKARRAGR
jgi:alpha-galactosidase